MFEFFPPVTTRSSLLQQARIIWKEMTPLDPPLDRECDALTSGALEQRLACADACRHEQVASTIC